ncbi:unnamed protein product [Orchesella dallaii]|uniref:Uncharacterized protein n=1 Tax=Orchesella dallaii TaxID=48710 RepID=A0ABP1PXF8_9HEXA
MEYKTLFMTFLLWITIIETVFTPSTRAAGIIVSSHPRRAPQVIISRSSPPSSSSSSGQDSILSPIMRLSPLQFFSNNGRVHVQYKPLLPRVFNRVMGDVKPYAEALSSVRRVLQYGV